MKDKFFVYQPDGDGCGDFVAFDGAFGESILDEAECVKMLNGFNSTCEANQALITKQAEQINMLRKELKLSTERLDAVWSNLGSMGAKAQADSNREALESTKPVEE